MPEAEDARLRRRFEASVRRFAEEQALWPEDGGLLVGVSGGADSTALLLALHALARRREIDIVVAHFDHGLRGASGSAETAAVRALAASLDLAFVAGRGRVRQTATAQGLSLEDAARRERYAFLASVAHGNGCSVVAVGHTASDQAETVLAHLLRGAGLDGIAGMAARSRWPLPGGEGLALVRPLLRLSRAETQAYCAARGHRPIEDESNASDAFQRNRLRHEALPMLRRFNPRVDEALLRLADAARLDSEYLDSLAHAGVGQAREGAIELPRGVLAGWPPALRRQALRLAWGRLVGDRQGLSERHVLAMEQLALQGRTGDGLDLGRGVRSDLSRDSLVLRLAPPPPPRLPDEPVTLTVPGGARFGPYIVTALPGEPHESATSVSVDAQAIGRQLWVRSRRPGDRMQPAGMSETKKLQDVLVDAHVPRPQRDALPLFGSERGIAWVGGVRLAEWARPRPGAATLTLSYRVAEDA